MSRISDYSQKRTTRFMQKKAWRALFGGNFAVNAIGA